MIQASTIEDSMPVMDQHHRIVYHGNDAGCMPAQNIPFPKIVKEGAGAVLSGLVPIRSSYSFVGWSAGLAEGGILYQPGDTILHVTKEMDLYAQWEPVYGTQLIKTKSK